MHGTMSSWAAVMECLMFVRRHTTSCSRALEQKRDNYYCYRHCSYVSTRTEWCAVHKTSISQITRYTLHDRRFPRIDTPRIVLFFSSLSLSLEPKCSRMHSMNANFVAQFPGFGRTSQKRLSHAPSSSHRMLYHIFPLSILSHTVGQFGVWDVAER